MADELGPAVAALQRKLDEQLQGVADTKRTINMLLRMSSQPPMFPDGEDERSGSVRSDQFYGKPFAASAAEYLIMRKQACQPDEILRGLEAGGFDFGVAGWKPDQRLRLVALALAKNTGTVGKFHKLNNGAFGLRSWYDEDFLKKAASGAAEAKAQKLKKQKAREKAAKSAAQAVIDAKPKLLKTPAKVKGHTIPGSTVQQEEKTA
jgi:hypothetical protein